MPEEITITIDGVEVKTQPGKMVLQAAIEAGIYIPYLCYHPAIRPYGACRLCVVEVEGGRGFPAACTLPVAKGMVIRTDTPALRQLRRTLMEMLLSEHPHGCLTCHRIELCGPQDICLRNVSVTERCVICPKNERCELKDTTRYLEMPEESPLSYRYRGLPIETGDPFYDRDYNLCIICGRCVRVCQEVRVDNAICFVERSGRVLVGTSRGSSLLESGCEFCGACIDVCPVGALVERDYKWEKARRVVPTLCPHCSVGCQLNLEVDRSGRVIRSIPELTAPANRGQGCFRGKFGLNFVNSRERLKTPLIRRNGRLEEATWEEALDLIAERLGSYRGDTFGLVVSARATNEEAYLAQKFARVAMATNNVDHSSNTRPELAAGLADALGFAAATNAIWELEEAGCILVVNANLTEEHNVVGVPIKRAVMRGARLIVIDPREVELTRYACIWLRPRPGSEPLLLGGLVKAVMDMGLQRGDWLKGHCQNLDSLAESLAAFSLGDVARETGVPTGEIEDAARVYATSERAAIVYALDNIPRERQRGCVYSLANLALLTGNLGRPSTGLYPLRQGANEQGAWDMGCVPHLLPGYRPVADSETRKAFEEAWGVSLPEGEGLGLREMAGAIREGRLKAMLVLGDSHAFRNGELEGLEFLAVQDVFLGPLAQRADVVLPGATFAEKEGTYTNLERRIQLLHPALKPPNHIRPEGWVLCQLAGRMGVGGFDYSSPAGVMEEIGRLVPIYSGVSHGRLEGEALPTVWPSPSYPLPTQLLYSRRMHQGIQWPCPDASHKGMAVLYSDGFPGGKARLMPLEFQAAPLETTEEYPLLLVPGRVLARLDGETEVVRGPRLNRIRREPLLEMNPRDASRLGIAEGEAVDVVTPTRRLRARAHLSERVHPGVVCVTFLFGELAVELASSEDPDPFSRVPGLPVSPARVERSGVA